MVQERIEDAAAFVELLELFFHGGGIALDEHAAEECWGAVFCGEEDAIACPGEAAVGLVDVDTEVQRWIAGLLAELFRDVLIEGDLIAEAALGRAACGGEEAVFGAVAAVHIRMGHAAEEGELVADFGEGFKGGREFVVASGVFGEKGFGEDAEVVGDDEKALGGFDLCGASENGL